MDKAIMVAGVFAIIAIVGIVLFVSGAINANVYYPYNNIYAQDFYVRPSGVQMVVESGSVLLQTDSVINDVCRNTILCGNDAPYVCCKHDGTSCILPPIENQQAGSCTNLYRSKCLCKEDYVAALMERYG
jgi:hypothetical protein